MGYVLWIYIIIVPFTTIYWLYLKYKKIEIYKFIYKDAKGEKFVHYFGTREEAEAKKNHLEKTFDNITVFQIEKQDFEFNQNKIIEYLKREINSKL